MIDAAANEIKMLRNALAGAIPALELGADALHAQAAQYHEAMAGYRPAAHAQHDADCKIAEDALQAVKEALGAL